MSVDVRRLTPSDLVLARRVFLTMTEVFEDPGDPLRAIGGVPAPVTIFTFGDDAED